MATNEKVIYASAWTCHDGKIYRPGDQLSGRMADHAIRGAQEQGLTTDSHAGAERARSGESERQRHVAEQQKSRSERGERADGE